MWTRSYIGVWVAAMLVASVRGAEPVIEGDLEKDLVAILGEDRGRIWGHAQRIILSEDRRRLIVSESSGSVSEFDVETLRRLKIFRPHAMRCLDIALLNDGRHLVTVSIDASVRLWDFSKPQPQLLDKLATGDTPGASWLVMSAAREGSRITVRGEKHLSVIDVVDDRLRPRFDVPDLGATAPRVFAMTPDGTRLVVCNELGTGEEIKAGEGFSFTYRDARFLTFDVSGERPVELSRVEQKSVESLTMCPDGVWLLGGDPFFLPDGRTHLWRLENDRLVKQGTLPGRASPFAAAVANHDTTRFLVPQDDTMVVHQKHDGQWRATDTLVTGHHARGLFLPDNSVIVARTPLLLRWDLRDGHYEQRATAQGHSREVMSLLFDDKTKTILTAAFDAIREWSLQDVAATHGGEEVELPFTGIREMWAWEPRKGFLLQRTVDKDNIIEGVRRNGDKMVSYFRLNFGDDYRNAAWCAAMHPRRELAATGHWDRKIRLWDVSVSPPEKLQEWEAHQGHVCGVAFSPDGQRLASVGFDRQTMIWEKLLVDGKQPVATAVGRHEDIVRAVTWSRDGEMVASGGEDGQILLYRLAEPFRSVSLVHPEDAPVKKNDYDSNTVGTLQFSRDGTQLLSGDGRGRVTLWDVKEARVAKRWSLPGWIWDVKFSGDERLIATANYNGTVYLLRAP